MLIQSISFRPYNSPYLMEIVILGIQRFIKLPATSDFYYFGHIAAFCEVSHPSTGHIGRFQDSGHPLKGWLWTDNYRICPIACDKNHGEGWLQAWNQAMSPKKVLLRVADLVKTSYMPKVILQRSLNYHLQSGQIQTTFRLTFSMQHGKAMCL